MSTEKKYEVGDEVIGDPDSRVPVQGIIVKAEDVPLFFAPGSAPEDQTSRKYLVLSDDGKKRTYRGESNLRQKSAWRVEAGQGVF